MPGQDLAASLERLAVAAIAVTTRALAEADAGFDLTFPQWRVLVILGEDQAGTRIGRVAARVGVTLPATGRLLRRLERRGLVALARDPDDRRATRARLTPRGEAVRQRILSNRRTLLGSIADAIDDPDQLTLPDGLATIAARLEPYA